jgi:dihydroorotate dehydrogenase electron transfer subunit
VLLVGGGTGVASLAPFAEALKKKCHVVFILGAKTGPELIYRKRLESVCDLRICTDDGSEGIKGFASEYAEKIIATERFNRAYACGPEAMMKSIMLSAKKNVTPAEGSLERFMKCAMGICDACAVGHLHVCTDGPVFDRDVLLAIPEFGTSKLSKSGTRETI